MSTDMTPRRRPTLLRCVGWSAVALLAGGTLAACGDDDPNLEDPAAQVVYTGDKDASIGTPSTFPTTTVLVTTTYFFPDNELAPADGAAATDGVAADPAVDTTP
ncbi:MAG: hypothetical protein KDB24_01535 [Microthrixaceae bacterium]|nr:hypothetical protein [Microthrixaceae bacterium]